MVAALSSSSPATATATATGGVPQQRGDSIPALADKGSSGNGEILRKQHRSREITSRYKSTTPTSIPTPPPTTPARRFPSPLIGRSSNGPEGPKRAVSAERKRPDSPASSSSTTSGSSGRPGTPRTVPRVSSGPGNADALRSAQRLWPSTHALSASLQLDHTLRPAENGIRRSLSSDKAPSDRKGTPERKRTPVRRPTTDQAENARPQDNSGVHRWSAGNSPKALSRSVDLSSDKDKSGKTTGLVVQGRAMNGTTRPVKRTPPIRSLTRSINDGPLPDSPQSVSRHMLSESRGRPKRDLENGGGRDMAQHQQQVDESVRQLPDETELASLESQPSLDNLSDCESLSSSGSGATTVTSSGSVKRTTARSRRLSQGDIVGCSLTDQDFSTLGGKNVRRLKSLSVSTASQSTAMSPSRLSAQQPPSPSRMLVSSPFRSIPSPTRTRIPSFQLPPSGHSSRASSISSLLHFPMDMRKGKKAMSQQEEAQYLRILHNRWLQWCFVNARAEAAKNAQRAIAEVNVSNSFSFPEVHLQRVAANVGASKVCSHETDQAATSETSEKTPGDSLVSGETHYAVVMYVEADMCIPPKGPHLESWAALHAEHSAALSGAMEALEAAVLRVPVTAGARADVQAIRDALCCTVDVMGSLGSAVVNLMPKTEKMDGLISGLAEVAKQEKATLEECGALLDRLAALEKDSKDLGFMAMALSLARAWESSILPRRLLPAGYRHKKLIFVASSGPLYILDFGRYKKRELESVPNSYLRWIVTQSPHRKRAYWAPLAQAVLDKRKALEASKYPPLVDHIGVFTEDQLDHMCRCGLVKRECEQRKELRRYSLFPPVYSNTMWAFTFLDSLASGASTSVLGRAGTAPFASARNERSIRAFRDCVDKLLVGDAQEDHAAAAPRHAWAFHIANALLPLLTAYSWDPLLLDDNGDRGKSMLLPITRPSLLLVLSTAPSRQELHAFLSSSSDTAGLPEEERRIASLHKLLEKKNVHALWFQPPGEAATLMDLLQAVKSSSSSSWGFSSVDTFLVATLVMPHRLLLPVLLLPLVFPRTTQRHLTPPAKLRVRISDKHRFVCDVGITSLGESTSLDEHGCSKIRLALTAVLPRSDRTVASAQQHRVVETYVVYQHRQRSGIGKELTGSARRELLQRLEHLPEELVCRQHHELSLILLFLARQVAVALVDMEVTQGGTTRQLKGFLEPLSISSATLRIVTGQDALTSARVSNASDDAKQPCTRLLSGSWNEAWSWCMKLLLQNASMDWMDPVFKESMYPGVFKAWKRQRWQESTSGQVVAAPDTGPGDCKHQEQDDNDPAMDVSQDMAESYTSSLAERLEGCISAGNFDAGKLVRDTAAAVQACRAPPETIHNLLLLAPKELSFKYTEGGSSHSMDHKLNEYTLQIQLRLEMLAAGQAPGMEAEFTEQVCELLYDIQFSLGGDIFTEEAPLVKFADRVVRSSYEKVPRVVDDIYTRMEFLGYDSPEPNAVEEMPLAAVPLAFSEEVVRSGSDVTKAQMDVERARRLSHFSGFQQKRKFVKKARLAATPSHKATVDSVLETPHIQLCSSRPKGPSVLPRRSIFP
ncbi:hypothetical protein SELMODRAFT_445777 [Selaginella moellendorffii]|uniref:Uncharacterized protein n=1 Tax=Selaginella moellendorffii TaxID=88036 RepID=D8SL70_SELML|nr:hypothetical protein SELMODRAFT_445777 [Selaginella moellendorffii]